MKKRIPLLIVIFLIFLHAVCNYIWLKNDDLPLWFDFGTYFDRSIDLYRSASNGGLNEFIQALFGKGPYYAAYRPYEAVVPLTPLPLYSLFGIHEDIAVMSLLVFFAILLLSVYGIAKEAINPEAGALAAFMVGTMPGIFWLSRHFSVEFATAGIMAVSIYFLIKSDNFNRKGYSALLGVCMALGALTKAIYFIFIFGPFLYAFLAALLKREGRKFRFGNIMICVGLCGLMVAPWLLGYLKGAFVNLKNITFSQEIVEVNNMPEVLSLEGISFYPVNTINYGMTFFYFLFFIPGCFYFARYLNSSPQSNSKRIKFIIFSWIIVPYIIFTFIPNKCEEYFNPFYPVVAIVVAVALFSLKQKWLKRSLMAFLVVVGCAQFYAWSFGAIPVLPKEVVIGNVAGRDIFLFRQESVYWFKKDSWRVEEILKYIDQSNGPQSVDDHPYAVCVMPDRGEMSVVVVKYYANLLDLPLYAFGPIHRRPEELQDAVDREADFIITKTGYQGLHLTEEERKHVIAQIERSGNFSRLPKEFLLPDDTVVSIYQRIRN